jgi:3-hydroxyacyl-[acyl-carrier-protein] dehydratase
VDRRPAATGAVLPRPDEILPHRPPFLLLDRLLELEAGRRGVAEWCPSLERFEGHFPGEPILPGVLLVEAMAQTGAACVLADPANRGKLALFAGIERARFRRIVHPGETLRLEAAVLTKGRAGRGKTSAWVGRELAAEAELIFILAVAR